VEGLRDHRYHLQPHCFGYVGGPGDVQTWKLPYLLDTGSPDTKRLPKAIQSLFVGLKRARGNEFSCGAPAKRRDERRSA
jgi:hypothetical protein